MPHMESDDHQLSLEEDWDNLNELDDSEDSDDADDLIASWLSQLTI